MSETPRHNNNQLNLWTRASDVRTFKSGCLQQWYLEKVMQGEYVENIWYPFGTAVHDAIEHVIREDVTVTEAIEVADGMMDAVLLEKSEGMLTTPRRGFHNIHDDLEKLMRNFERSVLPGDTQLPLYRDLSWPPTVEHMVKIDYPGYGIRTQVDAIFYEEGTDKFHIVDWKTGTTAKADPMQLHIYYYALVQQGFPDSGFSGWFHHLTADKVQMAPPYPGHEVVAEWIRYTEALKEADVFPAFPDWYCKYCRVQDVCPVFNPEANKEAMKDVAHEWVTQEVIFNGH